MGCWDHGQMPKKPLAVTSEQRPREFEGVLSRCTRREHSPSGKHPARLRGPCQDRMGLYWLYGNLKLYIFIYFYIKMYSVCQYKNYN